MSEARPVRVFLSYARADRARVAKLAEALQAAGITLWWDTAIEGGAIFSADIERELDAADVVVVAWSATSVKSDWVRDEASAGRDRKRLVPVQLDATLPPLGFRQLQSIDLAAWKGQASDANFASLLSAIHKLAGSAAPVPVPVPATPAPSRRLLIGGAAGVAALAAGGFGVWNFMGAKADDGTASVVVLPFANLSGDPEQAFFSDGIAEELRNALSQIRGLKVIGRVSSEQFRDTKDLAEAAETLGVDHVLTGSVRRSPTTIRIGAQLVDGRTGVESWSQSFDRPSGDVLAIQSSIATSVVGALSARLGKAAGAVIVGGTANPQAQALYLQADAIEPVTKADGLRRLALLDSAIALDPGYALAYSRRANTLSSLSTHEREFAPAQLMYEKAVMSSRRAVELAPNSGRALVNYSTFLLSNLDGRRAFSAALRAAQLEPGSVDALGGVTRTLYAFDPQRAAVLASEVIARDPFNARAYQGRAQALINLGRYAEALAAARKSGEYSNGSRARRQVFEVLVLLGRYAEARKAIAGSPPALALPRAALLEARAGNRAAADEALAALGTLDPRWTAYGRAAVHAQRGDVNAALAAVEAAMASRDSDLQNIAFDPFLDPLRKEPRFKQVQDRIIPPDLIVRPDRA